MTSQPIFAMVAGEASGDRLGAALIESLKEIHPGARFVGVGGAEMRTAGLESWWDSEALSVFGLFEVIGHLPRLAQIRRELRRRLLQLRPGVFVGIDAPDFNLGLEAGLKSAGIPTVHYVSPTVWAWRPGRVRHIARAADLVLCLFPFEPEFLRGRGIDAVYVGHPLADQIPEQADAATARRALGIGQGKPLVALLPGSRAGEVSRMSAPMIEAADLLSRGQPELRFVAAMANQRVAEIFRSAGSGFKEPKIPRIIGHAQTVMTAADVVVCASGTATLEAMLINRPMVVVYRLATPTFHLARMLRLVRTRFIALPNILAGEALVPELIQYHATPQRIAGEVSRWLHDAPACARLASRFDSLSRTLRHNAGQSAAVAVSKLLETGR